MKGSEFVFHYLHLSYYKYLKINRNRGGPYIDSPEWIKNKKPTINRISKKNKKMSSICCSSRKIMKKYEEILKE